MSVAVNLSQGLAGHKLLPWAGTGGVARARRRPAARAHNGNPVPRKQTLYVLGQNQHGVMTWRAQSVLSNPTVLPPEPRVPGMLCLRLPKVTMSFPYKRDLLYSERDQEESTLHPKG